MRVGASGPAWENPALPSRPARYTLLTRAKNLCVSAERRPRAILSGPLPGIRMNLELRTQTQLYFGLYERETFSWIRRLSREINSAIDIGVAEGEFALLCLMRTVAAGVWAFEPNAAVRPLFEVNLQLNEMANTPRLNIVERFAGDGPRGDAPRRAGRTASAALFYQGGCGGGGSANPARLARAGQPGKCALASRDAFAGTGTRVLAILQERGYRTQIIPQARWRKLLPGYRPLEHNRWLAAWQAN